MTLEAGRDRDLAFWECRRAKLRQLSELGASASRHSHWSSSDAAHSACRDERDGALFREAAPSRMGDLLHGLLALRHGKGFRAHLDLHKGMLQLVELREGLRRRLSAWEGHRAALMQAKAAEQARLIRRLDAQLRQATAGAEAHAAEAAQVLGSVEAHMQACLGLLQGQSEPGDEAVAQLSARMQQLACREAALAPPPPEAAPSFTAERPAASAWLGMDLADAGQGRDNGRDATGLLADHQKLLQQDGDEVGSSPLQALRLAMALPGSAQSVSGSSSEAAAEGREPDSARLRAAYQAMLQRMEQRHQQERARLQHANQELLQQLAALRATAQAKRQTGSVTDAADEEPWPDKIAAGWGLQDEATSGEAPDEPSSAMSDQQHSKGSFAAQRMPPLQRYLKAQPHPSELPSPGERAASDACLVCSPVECCSTLEALNEPQAACATAPTALLRRKPISELWPAPAAQPMNSMAPPGDLLSPGADAAVAGTGPGTRDGCRDWHPAEGPSLGCADLNTQGLLRGPCSTDSVSNTRHSSEVMAALSRLLEQE